ncbi:MAG TPA: hypothetical protein VJN18_13595 [Polyangiaceae bacterium]|nr:hypothetical protein [Polyangiaceae bacterium]
MTTAISGLRLQHCLILLSLAACGRGQEAEAPSTVAPEHDAGRKSMSGGGYAEPQTLAEAEELLERARADLDQVALSQPGAPPATAAGAAAPPPPAAAPAAEPAAGKRAEKASADEAQSEAAPPRAREVSPCETACKAFSSLERASDAVCRLDNEGGQRCRRARQIREDAARRVQGCGCSK